MADNNVNGIRGEFRHLTAVEMGAMIRMLRKSRRIKRVALAAEANMSEKTLERAEAGEGISEESARRIARALDLQEDVFVAKVYFPTADEAERLFEKCQEERTANYLPLAVRELRGTRDVLLLFRAHAMLGDDHHVSDNHLREFAELKESWWEWNAVSEDIGETALVDGARSFLSAVSSFESLGYEVKFGVMEGHRKNDIPYSLAVLVAFKKSKTFGSGAPNEVLLPKRLLV